MSNRSGGEPGPAPIAIQVAFRRLLGELARWKAPNHATGALPRTANSPLSSKANSASGLRPARIEPCVGERQTAKMRLFESCAI